MISQEKFESAINLLEGHFSKELSPATVSIWREHLNHHLTDQELIKAVKKAIIECEFMPTAKKLVEMGKQSDENSQAYQEFKGLPSEQMNMPPEQIAENLHRISEICKQMGEQKNLRKPPKPDYEALSKDIVKMWKRQGYLND